MATSLEARKANAAARWRLLGDRVQTVTPETVARVVIGLAVIGLSGWLVASSWPALAPFIAGVVIAYAVLPIANRLDKFMPRVLAALLAELVALAVLAGVAVLVVPPLVRSLVIVAGLLPTAEQVNAGLDGLQQTLGQLQEPIRGIVLTVATQVAENLRTVLDGFVNGAAGFVTTQILGLAGTLSFVLGLLVIPAWILTLVADDRQIRRRAANVITPGLRADVLALGRITDRAFATFLRVRVVLSIVVGVLVWVGLEIAQSLGSTLGIGPFNYALAGATLLGILQLIPELGFFLGLFPIALVLLVQGPANALVSLGVYWAATKLASMLVEDRVSSGVLDVHPALLIPGIVVLSQFGVLWTLAAAPLIAIGRDVVRYLAGRLADPPQPAGVLPGERRARAAVMPAVVPIPSAYRSAAQRGGGSSAAPSPPTTGSITASAASSRPVVAPARLVSATLPDTAFSPSTTAPELTLPSVTERSIAS